MPEHLQSLVYVLIAAVPAFFVSRKMSKGLVDAQEFRLWQTSWFLTVLATFLIGNFVLFAVFLGLLSVYVHRRPFNAIYLYIVLMLAAPALHIDLGVPGVANKLIDFSPVRFLALFFLLPAAHGLLRKKNALALQFTDVVVIAYVLLLVGLSFRSDVSTEVLRMSLIYLLDILLPYFVLSRALTTTDDIKKAMIAFLFAALPMAAAGGLETVLDARLFNIVAERWGIELIAPALFRDGLLRAAGTAVDAISFGFACMVGLGCLIASKWGRARTFWDYAAFAILIVGLLASISRGPWLGFAVLVFVSLAVSKRVISNITYSLCALAAGLLPLLATAFGQRLYNLLPFVGTVEKANESYRSKLLELSLVIIERNPLFGSHVFLDEPEMQELVQGQGIIDIVNTYVAIALEFGLIALLLFLLIFFSICIGLLQICFDKHSTKLQASAVLGTLVAILVTIGTVSSVSFIPSIYWGFAGLCVGLTRAVAFARSQAAGPAMKVIGQWQ